MGLGRLGRVGGAPAVLTPSSFYRSSAVDESQCQSLLSHSDISYDRTEDDVVRSDLGELQELPMVMGRAQVLGCCWPGKRQRLCCLSGC